MYKPFTSIFNSIAKLDKDLPSLSAENSCNHATNDGKIAIPWESMKIET